MWIEWDSASGTIYELSDSPDEAPYAYDFAQANFPYRRPEGLLEILSDPSEPVRMRHYAAYWFVESGWLSDERKYQLLRSYYSQADSAGKRIVLGRLGFLGYQPAVDFLRAHLEGTAHQAEVIESLGRLGDVSVMPLCSRILAAPRPTRVEIAEASNRFAVSSTQLALSELKLRRAALTALDYLDTPEAIRLLEQVARDKDESFSFMAALILAKKGLPTAEAILEEQLAAADDSVQRSREWLALPLVVRQALRAQHKSMLAGELARMGNKAGLLALKRLLQQSDGETRQGIHRMFRMPLSPLFWGLIPELRDVQDFEQQDRIILNWVEEQLAGRQKGTS